MAHMGKSSYTNELADSICECIATNAIGLRGVSKKLNIPLSNITDWLRIHSYFSEQYARAKIAQADILVEEILEISDDDSKDLIAGEFGEQANTASVNRAKLRVDARKWYASKLAPKIYGDKLDVTSDGEKLPSTINIIRDNGSNG
jgi:hypothetical protein